MANGAAATEGAAAEAFDLRTLKPRAWKNGAGLTREIACAPTGATLTDFDWRISVAEVAGDGPFSAFPGVDRCISLLRGAGMRLHAARGEHYHPFDHRLDRPYTPFHFAGEWPIEATLIAGPCEDFNVMTRRGRWRAEVQALRTAATPSGGDATLLLCAQGCWGVRTAATATTLSPAQGLLWRLPVPSLTLNPQTSELSPCLLLVTLCQDRKA